MTSDLWRRTGAIWPIGVSCSLTWCDLGAIAHIIQTAGIKTVLEVGVEHGGLASYLRSYGLYTGLVYRGIDITLNALALAVRHRDASAIDERDAWDTHTINEMRVWLSETPRPALIICDYRLRAHEDGIRVIDRLRTEYNDDDIPGMLITGDTAPDRLKEAQESGLLLLHKPVSNQRLRAAIEHLTARRAETSPPASG